MSADDVRSCWHDAPKDNCHAEVESEVQRIKRQQATQREDAISFMEMYAAGNVAGLGKSGNAASVLQQYAYDSGFNMSAALVDTAVSMVAQTPAIPMYLTTGGDYALMRKARRKSQVLQGQMTELAGELLPRGFLHAAKVGTGFIHDYIDEETGLPALKFVHMLELLVEHADGLYGKPRSCHYVQIRPREMLNAYYPAKKYAIEQAGGISGDTRSDFFLDITIDRSQMLEVWESWHLPIGKTVKDGKPSWKVPGRHTICIEGATLLDEAWEDPELPFTPIRYRERDFGYYGSGLIESCASNQNRVNELIKRVARGQDLGTSVIVLNPNGVKGTPVKTEQITNEIGLILNVDGESPQLVKWDGTQYDLQEQINVEFQRAMLVEGLSGDQVNGDGAGKGLNSGVAVRAADDVQTRRLVSPIKRFQAACIQVAKRIEARNNQLARTNAAYQVKARTQQGRQTFLQTSRWAELAIDEGNAQIEMMPMSALPTTPQGKWAAVMEWIDAGFVSQTYAMSLLQFPDLDSYADTQLAHMDMAQWQVEQILEQKRVAVYPRQNLEMAIDIVTRSLLKAITMEAPDPVVDGFEAFLVRCEELMEEAAAAAAAKQAAMQPAPGAPAPGQPPGGAAPPPGGGAPPGAPPRGPGAPPPGGPRPMQIAPQSRPAPMVQRMPA